MNLAVLSAWLHDIGKFARRAGEQCSKPEHFPQEEGHFTHGPYTEYFIKHLLPLPEELESSRSLLAELAASRHPGGEKSREHMAIQTAISLASGRDGTEPTEAGDLFNERMTAIFSKVRLNGKGPDAKASAMKYNLLPLNVDDAIFPVENACNGSNYQVLWQEFLAQLKKIPCHLGVKAWQATLVSLLERYCWCIPSANWRSLPDVSLYDHSAVTAAITQAILGCPAGQEKFILFGGDLSGIQAFIFGKEEPADRGATRLLRARSFLLQAVTRSIWIALLERLKLDHAAKIMDSGGHFVLLLPGAAQAQLEKFEYEVEKWLFEKFQGTVRINFAALSLAMEDFDEKNFIACFRKFGELLEAAKLHPFQRQFAAGASPVFSVNYAQYGQYGECAFCHTRAAVKIEDDKPTCAQCSQLKNLGKVLPGARYIILTSDRNHGSNSFSGLLFDDMTLHLCVDMPTEKEARSALQILSIRDEPVFTVAPIAGHVPLITEKDIERWQKTGLLQKFGDKSCFLEEECKPGEIKTFSMLAREALIPPAAPGDNWTSIPCLGICKADVDNLGMVFGLGLQNSFSLACYAMLARMLNYFFAAYLMRVIRQEFPDIYVVFAGGDDVFVIGPWPETIDFSLRMARDFRRFCADNPAVTISAGLPLVKAGLPMRAMKEEAEALLEASKDYHAGEKNALTLFGVSAHWQQAEDLLATGKWLANLCETDAISRGFLRRLLEYSRECREFVQGKNLEKNGLYLSHFRYDLARNFKAMQKDAVAKNAAGSDYIRLQELPNAKNFFAELEMGVAWAIYRTRIS